MYTKDDYFGRAFSPTYGYGESPCDIQQQADIDWLSEEFDEFLDSIGCHRTPNSEWYYNHPHSGIHAATDCDTLYYEPRECDSDSTFDWIGFWNARVGRMKTIHEFLEKREDHLNEAPWAWFYGYVRRRDYRYQKEFDIAQGIYEELVENTLEEVCGMYEHALYNACEWCESEEAAQEWVDAMN